MKVCEEVKKECIGMWFHNVMQLSLIPPQDSLRLHRSLSGREGGGWREGKGG